jgi:uncharacterized heparinase superfamily protein
MVWRGAAGTAGPSDVAPMRSTRRRRGLSQTLEPEVSRTRVRGSALHRLATSRLYRHTLTGQTPLALRIDVGQGWPGDAKRGAAITEGEMEFGGEVIREPSPRWFPSAAGSEWLAEWHGFGWLSDLAAAGERGRETARALARSWVADNLHWHAIAWRSDVLATRLCAWLAHFGELAGRDEDQALHRALLASFVAQLRHLGRTASWECAGAAQLRALKGLICGLAAVGGPASRLARALRLLEREINTQILADGGHISRSPSLQLQVLRDLIDIRGALRTAEIEPPAALHEAIERMAPMLRLFRHGDRRLCLFNDSVEEDGVLIDLVLTRSETRGPAPRHAPDTGFDRLEAGRSLVIVDTGGPPPSGFDEHAHAGTLSFEMSHGRERVIVNCGAYRGRSRYWSRVARASAAHSVLVVADTNSAEIREDGAVGRSPAGVTREHAEHEGRQWISAMHDGYRTRFGILYTRQIFLAADGEDLRGEDQLTGRPGAIFAVRFHLHPTVEASLIDDGRATLLRLPSGMAWRLRAAGAEMALAESIYLDSGEVRKTQQVVLSGTAAPGGSTVRWALRRERREAAAD